MTDGPVKARGAVPPAIAGLSGLEVLRRLMTGAIPLPMAETLGFHLVEVREGFAAFEGEPGDNLTNFMGTVHGGVALALVDSACGCAAYSLVPADIGYTTIETKANFTRPIFPGMGVIRCEGRVISPGRQIITTDATLTGADGRLLAHGTSTIMVLPPR
ncbi:MAG TPA: PaaI family thioesterase [Sphingobium sp.]